MNLENDKSADADDALDLLDDMDLEPDTQGDDSDADDEPRDEDDQDDDEAADDDGSDEESDDDAEADRERGKKPKSRAEKRINRLTREKNDALREAEYARREAAAAKQQFDELANWARTLQPTREQLEYGQQRGMTERDVQDMVRQQAGEMVEAERFEQMGVDLTKRLRDGGANDALSRITNPALVQLSKEAVTALYDAKFSVDVAKTIAGNEEVFTRFANLRTPVEQARFIDRLDGRLEARRASKTKNDAVKPTPRVRGSARKPEKDPEDMSQAEYEAYRKKQGWL